MSDLCFQIRPCMNVTDEYIDECDFEDADFFGVYFGKPGAMYNWCDFPTYKQAVSEATDLARQWGVSVDDIAARTKP